MYLNGTLGTGLNASSNPDPNSLTPKNPYYSPFEGNYHKVSADWTTQGKPALFPKDIKDGLGETPLRLHFVPSGGAAITYTVTMWVYNRLSNTWVQPQSNASISYTGEKLDYIENPGGDPIFLQLSSISAGTISVYFDNDVAEKH